MNKNHIDVLLAGSSELVTKYSNLRSMATTEQDVDFYYTLANHYLKIYHRAIAKSRLDKDT